MSLNDTFISMEQNYPNSQHCGRDRSKDPLTLKRKTPRGKIASLLDYEVVEKLQRRYCSALDPVESSAGRNAKICSGQKF